MPILRRCRWFALGGAALAAAAAGCATPGAASGPGGPAAATAPAGFTVLRQAESVPIAAIAFHAPYLWAGTEHGLRRWNVDSDDSQWIGPTLGASGPLGRNVSALAVDASGAAWVATEAGVGRVAAAGTSLRYEAKGALAGITTLLPTRDDGGAWAGGPGGLYRLDGKSWTSVDFLRDV